MASIDYVLAVSLFAALAVAWFVWTRRDRVSAAILASKEAELLAKDELIRALQEAVRSVPDLKAAAERVPRLEDELERIRLQRDSYLSKAAEHDALTGQISEAKLQLVDASARIEGLGKLLAAKDETVREASERAAGAIGERDRTKDEADALKATTGDLQARVVSLSADLEASRAQLEGERSLFAEKSKLLVDAERALKEAFGSLSHTALKSNNEAFLHLARQTFEQLQSNAKLDLDSREKAISALVEPVKQSLLNFDQQLKELENTRTAAYSSLTTQVRALADTQDYLRRETGNLVKALRAPQVRGRWGELTLRRVVEMAGMLDHCDFIEQESGDTDDGRRRPDMIVRMPGNRKIIVDAKVPLTAYLEALETQDEDARRLKLADHARQLRDHLTRLSRKSYWEQYKNETPEFVVLFIPGEVFYSAALEFDPSLIEQATNEKVMLASPANLIPLLRAVHFGWKQEAIAANATQISDLGRELYERVSKLAEHWAGVGKHLSCAVSAYNGSIGALEGRVLVSARKFQTLRVTLGDKDIAAPAQIEEAVRSLTAQELLSREDTLNVDSCLEGKRRSVSSLKNL